MPFFFSLSFGVINVKNNGSRKIHDWSDRDCKVCCKISGVSKAEFRYCSNDISYFRYGSYGLPWYVYSRTLDKLDDAFKDYKENDSKLDKWVRLPSYFCLAIGRMLAYVDDTDISLLAGRNFVLSFPEPNRQLLTSEIRDLFSKC